MVAQRGRRRAPAGCEGTYARGRGGGEREEKRGRRRGGGEREERGWGEREEGGRDDLAEERKHCVVALGGGELPRADTVHVGPERGARSLEALRLEQLVPRRRVHQRRPPVGIRRVDIGASSQQRAEAARRSLEDRNPERRQSRLGLARLQRRASGEECLERLELVKGCGGAERSAAIDRVTPVDVGAGGESLANLGHPAVPRRPEELFTHASTVERRASLRVQKESYKRAKNWARDWRALALTQVHQKNFALKPFLRTVARSPKRLRSPERILAMTSYQKVLRRPKSTV